MIDGTHGSLTVPQLEVWENPSKRNWLEPLMRDRAPYAFEDPLKVQIHHFCEVVRAHAPPMVSEREGLNIHRVVEAIKDSARAGAMVRVHIE